MDTRTIAEEYRLTLWAEVIRECNASGKSIKAYCAEIEIHTNVYFYWQRKLREAACQEFMPSTHNKDKKAVIPAGWAMCSVAEAGLKKNEVIIEIGKSRVTANADTDPEILAKVCQVLMTLC